MINRLKTGFSIFICAIMVIQLTGCGTLMYPERRGQRGGSLDAGVAILDGIGLLFGIIPGVIAFAVDFSNGTIYLPASHRASLDIKDMKQVKFDPKHYSLTSIEKIIKDETGKVVRLDSNDIKVTRLSSIDDMMLHFAKAVSETQNTELSL